MKTFLLTLMMASMNSLVLNSAWAQAPYNTMDPNMQLGPALEGGSLCTNGCPVGFGYSGLRVQPKYDQFFPTTAAGPTTAIPVQGVDGTLPGQ
jgi:hypothetical protein